MLKIKKILIIPSFEFEGDWGRNLNELGKCFHLFYPRFYMPSFRYKEKVSKGNFPLMVREYYKERDRVIKRFRKGNKVLCLEGNALSDKVDYGFLHDDISFFSKNIRFVLYQAKTAMKKGGQRGAVVGFPILPVKKDNMVKTNKIYLFTSRNHGDYFLPLLKFLKDNKWELINDYRKFYKRKEYLEKMESCKMAIVYKLEELFGVLPIEAMYLDTIPLMFNDKYKPYKEIFGKEIERYLWSNFEELQSKIRIFNSNYENELKNLKRFRDRIRRKYCVFAVARRIDKVVK